MIVHVFFLMICIFLVKSRNFFFLVCKVKLALIVTIIDVRVNVFKK